MNTRLIVLCGVGACLSAATALSGQNGLPPAPAGVQVSTLFGIDFSTIGNAGNRPFLQQDYLDNPAFWPIGFNDHGAVGSDFRISRTEISYGQWLPFIRAFAPHWTGNPRDTQLGGWLSYNPTAGYYLANAATGRLPVQTSWGLAAAYCNWLQAGTPTVVSDSSVFLTGAYDLTGLDLSNPSTWSRAVAASAGAMFRLPTMDEWYKAVYYDPNRFGPGQEGWWLFTDGRDRAAISGLPGVGESSIGLANEGALLPVAAYPGSMSAFGLLDTSGSASEWTTTMEAYVSPVWGPSAMVVGTNVASDPTAHSDYIGQTLGYYSLDDLRGFRVWASVPAASTGVLFLSVGLRALNRRRI